MVARALSIRRLVADGDEIDQTASGGLAPHWRKKPLAERLGISTATLDRWRRQGRFPPGIRLSDQVVVWSDQQIAEYLRRLQEGGEDA